MRINTIITKVGLKERNDVRLHPGSSMRWDGFMKENVPEKISLPLELKLYSIWGNLGKGWEIREERLNV